MIASLHHIYWPIYCHCNGRTQFKVAEIPEYKEIDNINYV